MNRLFLFRCTLILVLSITSFIGFAQSSSLNNNSEYTITKRLRSIEDGLASHEVFCGLQDKQGFMWFGTYNGLYRFDGYNLTKYSYDPENSNTLSENTVNCLFQDRAGDLSR